MTEIELQKLLAFVSPFYQRKDILHGLKHIERLLYSAKEIIQAENLDVDFSIIVYGAYFHGLASQNTKEIETFLIKNNLPERIAQVALDSLGKTVANTREGKYYPMLIPLKGASTSGI